MHEKDLEILRDVAKAFAKAPAGWALDKDPAGWKNVELRRVDGEERVVELKISAAEGELSPALGGLEKLRKLEIRHSKIKGPLPDELGGLQELSRLVLDHAVGFSALPEALLALPKLNELGFYFLELAELPASLGSLPKLYELEICACPLRALPAGLGGLPMLKELRLKDLALGALPEELGSLARLSTLSAVGCGLKNFPDFVRGLHMLRSLNLADNDLQGPVPEFLFALPELASLNLRGNSFSGPIPEAICQAENLRDLDLRHNRLSGQAPACLASSGLLTLELDGNEVVLGPEVAAALGEVGFYDRHPFLRFRKEQEEDDSDCAGPSLKLYGVTRPFRIFRAAQPWEFRSKKRRSAFWDELQVFEFSLNLLENRGFDDLDELLPVFLPKMNYALRKAEAVPQESIYGKIAEAYYDVFKEEVDSRNAREGEAGRELVLPERDKLEEAVFLTGVKAEFNMTPDGGLEHFIRLYFSPSEHLAGDFRIQVCIVDGDVSDACEP
ncbi:hypothetical protein LJC36_05975 [Desulfovibrio sp. OttesenSCG-928-C14]|nr:hypothetical protein [Desulfovibrio sp. OttesenSCG-928-C14]